MLNFEDNVQETASILKFELPRQKTTIIKVIGVGGGGGNAVNHMYNEGIHDVSFVVCNTDNQALDSSPVPIHLQLGTEGLGAGNRPAQGRKAAEESLDGIRSILNDGTKMVFITAGMGGGTGTGAAPIVAREAKKLDILTVGIVTIPFRFEGNRKIDQALDGLEEMQKHVDALLVVNNERLREIYPNLTLLDAFAKADDTLSIAAKSIAEIITLRGTMNLDFQDVKTVLKEGGVAIMSTAFGEGEERVNKAIQDALNSPLLNHSDVFKSKRILVNIVSSQNAENALMMEEMNEVNDFMAKFDPNVETKFGIGTDETLGKKVKVTILATGFGLSDVLADMGKGKEQQDTVADEVEEERKRVRRDVFYTNDHTHRKRRYQVYRFNAVDLDNEEVISMVESSPTFKRDMSELNAIRNRDNAHNMPEKQEPTSEIADNTIVF